MTESLLYSKFNAIKNFEKKPKIIALIKKKGMKR
jgi:hypothetical protein